MGLLGELDKYHAIFELIKNDEPYDKKQSVLNGEELFQLCQNRYDLLQEILKPLKKRLGENIEIIDIGFAKEMQEDTIIYVRYSKDGKQNYFTISNLYFDNIEISSTDNRLERYSFVLANREMIFDIFKQVYMDSLDSEININSTSKKFVITDKPNAFIINDTNSKLLTIEGTHTLYAKEGLMYNKEKIITPNTKLKEMLTNDDNIKNIYKHLHVYEEDVSKTLIKKTNR